MSILRNKVGNRETYIWPGFVDALATLLMVVIFVLMIFSLAQFYLNQLVTGKDEALTDLNNQISEVYNLLQIEKENNSSLSVNLDQIRKELKDVQTNYSNLKNEKDTLSSTIDLLNINLTKTEKEKESLYIKISSLSKEINDNKIYAQSTIDELKKELLISKENITLKLDEILKLKNVRDNLQLEVAELISKDKEINTEILKEKDYSKTLEEKITELKDKSLLAEKEASNYSALTLQQENEIKILTITLSQVKLKLSQLQGLFDKQKLENEAKNIEIETLGNNLNSALANRVQELQKFRSEFFGRLSELLEERKEIQIVGDRFVFQSEVLFEAGSAEIGNDGQKQLQKLSITLKEIVESIPSDINWVLQVEGHTDKTPIKGGAFFDNWDLSTERALSVVRFLIREGINPKRLSASGYGEHQPLSTLDEIEENSKEGLRKNRRIELKITQRIEQ